MGKKMSTYYDKIQIVFQKLVEKEVSEILGRIGSGNIQSLDVYKFECGRIRGLDEANSLLNEAIRTVLGYDKTEEE